MLVEFSVINPVCHASVPARLSLFFSFYPSIHPSIHPSLHPFTSISPFPRLGNWSHWACGKRQPLGTNTETQVCQAFCFNEKLKLQQSHPHTQIPHTHWRTYIQTLQLAGGQNWVHNYLCCVESQRHLTTGVTTLFACRMGDLCQNVKGILPYGAGKRLWWKLGLVCVCMYKEGSSLVIWW